MTNIVVVERADHVAAGKLAATLAIDAGLSVTIADRVPVDLTSTSVLILNSLPPDFHLPQDRIVNYIQSGGGVLSLHEYSGDTGHQDAGIDGNYTVVLCSAGLRWRRMEA